MSERRWFLHAGTAVVAVEGLAGLAYDAPSLFVPAAAALAIIAALTRITGRW